MKRLTFKFAGLVLALVLGAAFLPQLAMADCSVSGNTATCEGDPGVIDYSDGTVDTVIIEDLTANIAGPNPVTLSFEGAGDSGEDASDLKVSGTFDGNMQVLASETAITVSSTAGSGENGKHKTDDGGAPHADDGTAGGDGGTVTITLGGSAPVTSGGAGIFASSIGGQGGSGGNAESTCCNAHGGQGADGGMGGAVNVTLSDDQALSVIDGSGIGIYVSSQAGSGGDGGEADAGPFATSYAKDGGDGGDGGRVEINATESTSEISTTSEHAHGIVAESLAGSGGDGGDGVGGFSNNSGDGGQGGTGGTVEIELKADLSTTGAQSQGIWARSFGGDGGNSGDLDGGGTTKGPGPGGTVSVTFDGSITTFNEESNGIFAQSVGGFAGDGGDPTSEFVAYGASDESGGKGGTINVTLNSGAHVATGGDFSAGVHLISIGGGGGKGSTDVEAFDTIGGTGSAGGDGGAINFNMTDAVVETSGTHASAIELLSIGGGGGAGGSETSIVSIGGSGGTGGNGADIRVSLAGGEIGTSGQYSDGLQIQSVGGGGGKGSSSGALSSIGGAGEDGGNGGYIEVDVTDDPLNITTYGADSDAIFLQSLGGGGGKGSSSYSVGVIYSLESAVGGTGGDGGYGRQIVYQGGANVHIQTSLDRSRGFVAQSVGGGGGHGGNAMTLNVAGFGGVNIATGGNGGSGGNGGAINIDLGADIVTAGHLSTGALAQSVGGSGGASGSSLTFSELSVGFSDMKHTIGSSGGAGGDGNDVSVTSTGDVTTFGHEADGLLVQSVGGGGGASGVVAIASVVGAQVTIPGDISTALGGGGGVGGNGGTASATVGGDVRTSGDNAIGVLTQSVGGGGGKGGFTSSVGGLTAGDLNVTVGQSGGAGGTASDARLELDGDVTTSGNHASGAVVQSVGGSGGAAGNVVEASSMSLQPNVTLGGVGGDGGGAGTAELENSGVVTTSGSLSNGLIAQSIGGGGGMGGMVFTADITLAGVQVDLGSAGGDGSTADAVSLGNSGQVATNGVLSYGALAQSIGGMGGAAGVVANVSADVGVVAGDVNVLLGGNGGKGGTAGSVMLNNSMSVTTSGFGSTGLFAQSIGGHGGSGGSVIAGQMPESVAASASVNLAIGGDGGDGGASDDVKITNSGTVGTFGAFADGMQGQSISGNGGAGGNSYVAVLSVTADSDVEISVQVGGDGGDGGKAGDVTLENSGTLTTSGGMSNGMYGQSIGGSGGDGGSSFAVFADFGTATDDSFIGRVTAQVGGTGGTGNDAGEVTLTNSGTVAIADDLSRAMFAQSVGGGGGDGGSTSQHSLGYLTNPDDASNKSYSFEVTIGGDGGSGGDGEAVNVSNDGNLSTTGLVGYGIYAQSVGGGGGTANDGPMNLPDWVARVHEIREYISQAKEVMADIKDPSDIFTSFGITLGGTGGAGGNGGDVTAGNSGGISTTEADATAIFAQSVGGGGGSGGDGSQGLLLNVTLGGDGSSGGDGGAVTVSSPGAIATQGERAMGVFAQSVGGGGGAAGDVEATFIAKAINLNYGAGIIATDGGDGDGGEVKVDVSGTLTTAGTFAHGVFAQSIGGGGGSWGLTQLDTEGDVSGYTGAAGSAGGTGDGGEVDINVSGDISVAGDYAVGVVALSAGGDGGASTGGDVTIEVSGSVSSTGTNGRAIFAQSDGGETSGAVALTIGQGASVSSSLGSSGYDTVSLFDGETITLVNDGVMENLSGDNGSFVIYTSGSTAQAGNTPGTIVTNNGVITGSIYLAGDDSNGDVYNHGTFNLGQVINLGSGDNSKFHNYGTISPAGIGTIGTSEITSAKGFEMHISGVYVPDISFGSQASETKADLIKVASSNPNAEASLGFGTVAPYATGSSLLQSGTEGSVKILEVSEKGYATSVLATRVTDSEIVDYRLSSNLIGSQVNLHYKIDYTGATNGLRLGRNHLNFAEFLDGSIPHARNMDETSTQRLAFEDLLTHALNSNSGNANSGNANSGSIANIYEQHTLDEAAIGISEALTSALEFHELLHSCPNIDPAQPGDLYKQQDCTWITMQGQYGNQDRTDTNPGYQQNTFGGAAGVQREIADGTFVEFAGQFVHANMNGSNFELDGHRLNAGAALKRELINSTISASVVGGHYEYDYNRLYSTASGTYAANSNPDGNFVSAEARIEAILEKGGFYGKPGFAVAATHTWQNSFQENGNGDLNWQVNSMEHTSVAVRPVVEIGKEFSTNGHTSTAFIRAGLTAFLTNPEYDVIARFADPAFQFPEMTATFSDDRIVGDLAAGFHIGLSEKLNLSGFALGSLSENAYAAGGYGKLMLEF